jgi:xanthine dehydrogenase accessory factor
MATENIYNRLAQMVSARETVAVATIIDVKGSVPREVGAKMIIHPLGKHVGTVGGGCGEADVIRAAIGVIQTGQPATVRVDLTEDISMQTLGVCGGILDVFIEQVGPVTPPAVVPVADRLAALQASIAAREPVALAKVVTADRGGKGLQYLTPGAEPALPAAPIGHEAVIWLDRPPLGSLDLGDLEERVIADAQAVLRGRQHRLLHYPEVGVDVFVEVQRRAPELLIAGAGHIAVPLAQLAGLCDFAVTVLDDRPMYANQARFPTARKVLAAPLRETVRDLTLDQDSFIVLVTRGHSQDVECLLEVLDRPVAYIGMIGSQRRVDAVFKLLAEDLGIDPVRFDRVYAPIGIDIGAQTPAEIAVCIMAEIINVLRGGPAVSLADKRRTRDQARRARKQA